MRKFIALLLLLFLSISSRVAQSDVTASVTASRRTAIVNAVERASPAVVNISAIRVVEQQTSLNEWFFWERDDALSAAAHFCAKSAQVS